MASWGRIRGDHPRCPADAAQNGDTAALGVFTQAGEWLGIVVAGLINLLNPEVIMLGGGS